MIKRVLSISKHKDVAELLLKLTGRKFINPSWPESIFRNVNSFSRWGRVFLRRYGLMLSLSKAWIFKNDRFKIVFQEAFLENEESVGFVDISIYEENEEDVNLILEFAKKTNSLIKEVEYG